MIPVDKRHGGDEKMERVKSRERVREVERSGGCKNRDKERETVNKMDTLNKTG